MKALQEFSTVLMHRNFIDFRKGIFGLAAYVQAVMNENLFAEDQLFVFCNRSRTALKILYWTWSAGHIAKFKIKPGFYRDAAFFLKNAFTAGEEMGPLATLYLLFFSAPVSFSRLWAIAKSRNRVSTFFLPITVNLIPLFLRFPNTGSTMAFRLLNISLPLS